MRRTSSVETNRGRAAVGVEAFDLAEFRDRGDGLFERLRVEMHEARAALEHIDRQPGKGFAGAAGGQRVARAGEEIAGGDGRVAAEKNRAGGDDLRGDLFVLFRDDGDVLG